MVIDIAPEVLPEFRCEECLRGPDKTEFDYDAEGNHPPLCVKCISQRTASRKLAVQDRQKQEDVTKLLRLAVRKHVHLPALSEMAGKLAAKFGGTDAVVDLIYVKLSDMLKSDHISPKIQLDGLKFLVNFLRAGMASVNTTFDASVLTDDELETAMREYVAEIFGPAIAQSVITEHPPCQP